MNIANCKGDFEIKSWDELEQQIRESSSNPYDDIWISGETEYPCLAVLINGSYACVHFFLNEEGDMWQSVGEGDKDMVFVNNGEESEMPADSIISLERAVECAKQFYQTKKKPTCIEWREL